MHAGYLPANRRPRRIRRSTRRKEKDLSTEVTSQPQRIRDRLAGHHILITGSTGFLAKAFVEKLLRAVDTVGGLHLLVRPRSGGKTADMRVD